MPQLTARGLPYGMHGHFPRVRKELKETIAPELDREPEDVAVYLHEQRLYEDEPGRVCAELTYLDDGRTPELIHGVGEAVVAILDKAIKDFEEREGHPITERIVFLGDPRNRATYVPLRRG